MPTGNQQPSVRFRRIGSALRKAREAAGMTLTAASRRYGRSQSWLSTLENGLHTILPEELIDLLNFYGVPEGPERRALIHLAEQGAGKSWQRRYEGRISPFARDLASLEEDAARIRNFEPDLIPGLAQTREYALGLILGSKTRPGQRTQELVDFRMGRQAVLDREDPPGYQAIIGESALHQIVGSPAVTRRQLQQLLKLAERRHVSLRVLPFTAGASLGMAGPFVLLSLRPPGDFTVTVIEQFSQGSFVEDEREVLKHEAIFAHLLAATLDQTSSLEVIDRLASQL